MFVYPGGSAGRAQTVFEIVVAEAGQRLGVPFSCSTQISGRGIPLKVLFLQVE